MVFLAFSKHFSPAFSSSVMGCPFPSSVAAAAAAKSLQSCPTLCDPIDGSPPGSPRPWDSPGKNTAVGCHFLLQCVKMKSESEVAQSCPTLSDPLDCSLPGSSIHGIFQARAMEWGAIAFSASSVTPSQLSTSFRSCVLKVQLQRRHEASASPQGCPRHLVAVPSFT